MLNPLHQLSPRLSASYALTDKLSLNASTGRYYQLPPYTALGFSTPAGVLVNKDSLKYMAADHFVAGFEIVPVENIQLLLKDFIRIIHSIRFQYVIQCPCQVKVLIMAYLVMKHLFQHQPAEHMDLNYLARLKEFRKINLVFSYTYVRSEFRGLDSKMIPSSWDNKHLLNLTATKKFNRNWDIGIKWRFVGGAPYTPYDYEKSSYKIAWELQGQGYLDYSEFNTLRLKAFHQLDIRVDKQYFFKNWSLMLYADVQNVYNFKADQPPILVTETDSNGNPVTDPSNPLKYSLKYLSDEVRNCIANNWYYC